MHFVLVHVGLFYMSKWKIPHLAFLKSKVNKDLGFIYIFSVYKDLMFIKILFES